MDDTSFWQLINAPRLFWTGERSWGWLRLAAVLCGVVLLAQFRRILWGEGSAEYSALWLPMGWRHLVLPLAALVGALLVGANYVRSLHQLPEFGPALRHLFASAFAIGYPRLTIVDGKADVKTDEFNLIPALGGPGYLHVRPGSAALLENLIKPSNVYGSGVHFVSRTERIGEIISLADQHGFIASMSATTKDGIEVAIKNVNYRYRLYTGHRPRDYQSRLAADPYPFSLQAARCMAYSRSVNPTGLVTWDTAVRLGVDAVITDYISQHQFDQVSTPRFDQANARAEIAGQMQARGLRDRLRGVGAELLWFDIGHIEPVRSVVSGQHVDTWAATWTGRVGLTQSYAEAQRISNQELGRAEAQANMLTSIMQTLEDVDFSSNLQNLHGLIIMRTAQILEAMATSGQALAGDEFQQQRRPLSVVRMLQGSQSRFFPDE